MTYKQWPLIVAPSWPADSHDIAAIVYLAVKIKSTSFKTCRINGHQQLGRKYQSNKEAFITLRNTMVVWRDERSSQ